MGFETYLSDRKKKGVELLKQGEDSSLGSLECTCLGICLREGN